jgi:8-oxo-dGTP pyrophosphatase MutT (NUDIX family)
MQTGAGASWILEARSRLASPPPRRLPPRDVRQAAVLVPLYVDAGELWTLLTRRADSLPHHRGQIAFPGGGRELGEDAWGAALRESQEELGLDPARILRVGQLDEAETPSGFRIIPCVGAVPNPLETRANPGEIAEVFAVPLLALANPQLVEDRRVRLDGADRVLRIYHVGGRQIWGLTARILQNLLERLGVEGTMPVEERESERPDA